MGSNIANLGLILGLTALLRPAPVQRILARTEVPVLLLSTLVLGLFLVNGHLSTGEAALLLLASVTYSAWMVFRARRDRETDLHLLVTEAAAETAGAPKGGSITRLSILVGVGLGLLVVGGHLLVQGATALALAFGMSERLVGLTLVAVGTSVPELATSMVAAWRGHTDMAVGNVVGSNIFNILLCLGLAGLPGSLRTMPTLHNPDLAVLGGFTLLGLLLLRTERTIRRWEGGLLFGSYVGYLAWLALG